MSKLNFISCVNWIKRGVAKETPEKVSLTKEELKRIIDETRSNIPQNDDDNGDEEMNSSAEEEGEEVEVDENVDIERRYNLDTYDDEDDNDDNNDVNEQRTAAELADLTVYASNEEDPYLQQENADVSDDEEEDFKIKPNDNLILVGHIENDTSTLEVYVYNEDDDLYVHHDILLPAYPMCFEWLNYDSSSETKLVNYVAIGDMTKDISIWDLDVVNTLEPVFKLVGHNDAVLDLSWNSHLRKVIASASADHTVCLWNLENRQIGTHFTDFNEKVQCLQFHPFEAQTLLIGDFSGTISVADCQSGAMKRWNLRGCEIEKVLWNSSCPYQFFSATDKGFVYCFDCRVDGKSIYSINAHSDSVTGLEFSSRCPGCLITASSDGTVKVWDVDEKKATFVSEFSKIKVGSVLGMSVNPDLPFIIGVGGDSKSDNFKVIDITKSKQVRSHFVPRLHQHKDNASDVGTSSCANN